MESVSTLLGEWNSFSGVNVSEEAIFMSQLLENFPCSSDLETNLPFEVPSTFWPHHELTISVDEVDETYVYMSDNTNSYGHCLLQDHNSSDGSSLLFPSSSDADHPLTDRFREGSDNLVPEQSKYNKSFTSSRKRSASMPDVHNNKEKIKCRKIQKLVSEINKDEAECEAAFGQTMKVYASDDDSNWSHESSISPILKEAPVPNSKSKGKTKASRGSATDPQSVYARKRRERINERLRILQKLVPNGTKVDISTMLEEAVQYVKFLQLQIKLLSSDDMWMYAPIAYNGMGIGLDLIETRLAQKTGKSKHTAGSYQLSL